MSKGRKISGLVLIAGLAGMAVGLTGKIANPVSNPSRDAQYVQLVDSNKWQMNYPQVKELYAELKNKPEVQNELKNYSEKSATNHLYAAIAISGILASFISGLSLLPRERKS
ncbi:MAG: hypothetical protein V1734_01465 [Nanoarchaeota archaeon]